MIKTLVDIVISFTKIGLTSLGGGNSILQLLEYEVVDHRHWIVKAEFINMLGTSYLFPGLTAIKLAALIGYKAGGVAGMLLALICISLPGVLMVMLAYGWLTSHTSPVMRKIMTTVQYGALALLAAATYSVGQGIVGMYFSIPIAISCFVFFLAVAVGNISPFLGFIVFIAISFFLVQ